MMEIILIQVLPNEEKGIEEFWRMDFQNGNKISQLPIIDNQWCKIFVEHHGYVKNVMLFNGMDAYYWQHNYKK